MVFVVAVSGEDFAASLAASALLRFTFSRL